MSRAPTIDCMIAGAQKAGSTSLLRYLESHPRVLAHPHTEMAFFADDGEFEMGWEAALTRYYGHAEWRPDRCVVAKNVVLLAHREGLARLHAHNPECRIVLLFRDPVERFLSAYRWEAGLGREDASFDEVVDELLDRSNQTLENPRYWMYMYQSEYPAHLRHIRELFSRKRVGVYLTEELASEPDRVVTEILDELGLDPAEGFDVSGRYNETREIRRPLAARALKLLSGPRTSLLGRLKEMLPEALVLRSRELLDELSRGKPKPSRSGNGARAALLEHFEPRIAELEEMLDRNLDSWREGRNEA